MKWLSAIIRAGVLFLAFVALDLMFNFTLQVGLESWQNSNAALGTIPKAAISLYSFVAHNTVIIASVILVLCLALSFAEVARKK